MPACQVYQLPGFRICMNLKAYQYIFKGILSILLLCRPPSNSVSRNAFTIRIASDSLINLAGNEQIFASLCNLARRLISSFQHNALLIPWCLFTVMFIPLPVPQIEIPRSKSPPETAFARGWPKSG